MKRNILYLFLFSILFTHCNNHKTGDENLLLKERVVREIRGGQRDTFDIKLESRRFIYISLFQTSIDIVVQVLDPQYGLIREIDYLKSGPEFISFTTMISGDYHIIVQPFNPMAKPGRYNIGLEKNIETKNSKEEKVNQLFAEFDNDYRTGAATAIVESGKVIYKNGFGIADIEDKIPVKSSTRLNICSIGKQFTAYAIALLQQDGKLSVNDDIRKYLPEVFDFGSTVTIQHLLNHSSGLREIADILELTGKKSNGPFSKEDVFKLIYRQRELNFLPGTEYLYCNTGYILLAEIIERISGKPYTEWITENIFKPLGMNDTYFYQDPDKFIDDFSWSYTLDNNGSYHKEQLYKTWYVGAGNVFSTVEDMSKWLMNFDYPKVGNAKIIAGLDKVKMPMNTDSTQFYTYGRVLAKHKGLKYYWHGGGGFGYTAQIVHFPEYRFGAIVLSNFIYGSVHSRSRQIADIFLNDRFTITDTVYYDYKNPCKPIRVNDNILSDLQGIYLNDSGITTNIFKEPSGLVIQTSGFGKAEMYPLSDSVFFIKEADVKMTFARDRYGRTTGMKSYDNGVEYVSKKIEYMPDRSINSKDYEGRYYSKELDIYYTITKYGNTLVARNDIGGRFNLTRFYKNLFKGDEWYFSNVEFVSTNKEEMIEFKITNDRAKNIRFIKLKY